MTHAQSADRSFGLSPCSYNLNSAVSLNIKNENLSVGLFEFSEPAVQTEACETFQRSMKNFLSVPLSLFLLCVCVCVCVCACVCVLLAGCVLTSLIIFTASRVRPSFLEHMANLLFMYTNTLVSLPGEDAQTRYITHAVHFYFPRNEN